MSWESQRSTNLLLVLLFWPVEEIEHFATLKQLLGEEFGYRNSLPGQQGNLRAGLNAWILAWMRKLGPGSPFKSPFLASDSEIGAQGW